MKKWTVRVLNFIGIMIMLLVILVMLPFTVPKLFGYEIYGVLSESMTPAYPVGSVIFVEKCGYGDVRVGEAVTFTLGTGTGNVMTHRIISKDEEAGTFLTKGDANNTADPEPVNKDRLIGRVRLAIPLLGKLAQWTGTGTGKAVCFILFACSLIMWITADLITRSKAGGGAGKRKPTGRSRSVGTLALRIIGLCLILGAFAYICTVLLEYRRGEGEYDKLREEILTALPDGEAPGQEMDSLPGISGLPGDQDLQAVMGKVALLMEENEEMAGFLVIEGTDITYPVMQADNNEKYLRHTFSGEKNAAGSIFLEAANTPDFEDSHTILYGHNMKNGSMFGSLKKYRTGSYYKEHPYITIFTADAVFRYEIFSCYDISEYGDIYQIRFSSREEFGELVRNMKNRSVYDTGVETGDQDKVLTLSTCSTKGNRFVVHARRIELLLP